MSIEMSVEETVKSPVCLENRIVTGLLLEVRLEVETEKQP